MAFDKDIPGYEIEVYGVLVNVTDRETIEGFLLVGADGSWSKVRRQLLPNVSSLDSEGRLIYGKTIMTPDFLERFNTAAMNGMTLIRDDSKSSPSSCR